MKILEPDTVLMNDCTECSLYVYHYVLPVYTVQYSIQYMHAALAASLMHLNFTLAPSAACSSR